MFSNYYSDKTWVSLEGSYLYYNPFERQSNVIEKQSTVILPGVENLEAILILGDVHTLITLWSTAL